jgi:hypothetical protein
MIKRDEIKQIGGESMDNPAWRVEAHVWFENFDEYAERELGCIRGKAKERN